MATQNDVTGDFIFSKPNSKQFEENFDRIFGKKEAKSDVLCNICGKDLKSVKECAWTSCPLNLEEAQVEW